MYSLQPGSRVQGVQLITHHDCPGARQAAMRPKNPLNPSLDPSHDPRFDGLDQYIASIYTALMDNEVDCDEWSNHPRDAALPPLTPLQV